MVLTDAKNSVNRWHSAFLPQIAEGVKASMNVRLRIETAGGRRPVPSLKPVRYGEWFSART
jgi:hypothetical protein